MIGDLLTNPIFLVVGTIAAVVATLAVFKKLFKVTFIAVLLIVVLGIIMLNTGEDPKTLTKKAKRSIKELESNVNQAKKVVANTADKIEAAIPKEAKKSIESVSKKADKITKEQNKALKKLEKDLKKYKKELGN